MGLGISGFWTAHYLAKQDALVTVSDSNQESALSQKRVNALRALEVRLECGTHHKKSFKNADLIVISPGVPHMLPLLCEAREQGIPVIGELELAASIIKTPVIAITGTNGKSTVTELLGRLLNKAGYRVFVGGNLGTPLIAAVAEAQKIDYAVVEVSSFQLDTTRMFNPYISVILNISPDHLDRYPGYEDYVRSKLKIFKNQQIGQYVILNNDDQELSSVSPDQGASILRYGLTEDNRLDAFLENKEIIVRRQERRTLRLNIEQYRMPGKHNLGNLMAIVLAADAAGVEPDTIQEAINNFRGLPNRIEHVKDVKGVAFYNDSKATNVDAAVRAVLSLDAPIVLIAGGRHKGADYANLVEASKEKVKKVVLLGESRQLLKQAFDGVIPLIMAKDMEEAVFLAFQSAGKGDAVLLSPACSSFDMFEDYKHRGTVFRKAVEKLNHG